MISLRDSGMFSRGRKTIIFWWFSKLLFILNSFWPMRYKLVDNISNNNNLAHCFLMDHNMVPSYDYAKRKRRWWRTNVPPLRAISMAMRMHWSNTERILAQCSMIRATPEATGCRHWATSPGIRQGDSKQKNNVKCTNFGGCFNGCGGAMVLYRAHRPMEKVHGFHKSH